MYIRAIKAAARITHNAADDDLYRLQEYAIAELKRMGVPETVITAGNTLVKNAVVMYAMSEMSPTKAEQYAEAWVYQADCLRKHKWSDENV